LHIDIHGISHMPSSAKGENHVGRTERKNKGLGCYARV
jgi:hypothetical protein